MADSAAFEPVQRSNDHIPVAARVNELSADAQASRPRPARGLLRPSQVPVPGGTTSETGSPPSGACFSMDFSQIPVHPDGAARAPAAEVGARAYTSDRPRPAGGPLRPSQVPVPGGTTWPAGLPSPAGERAHHGLKALRPGGVSTGAAPVPARPSTVPAQPIPDLLPGPGQPLAAPVKEEMEARLGADFSRVRVHTGSAARASAAGVGARAYTFGPHVVIGGGGADKHTLAHELTHVIQQRQGPVAGTDHGNWLKLSDPSDHDEKAAEVNAARVMRAPLSQHLLTAAGSSVHDGNENLRKPPAQDRQPRGDRDADRSGTNPPVAVQRLAIGDAPTTWGEESVSRSGEGSDGVFFVGPGGARVVVKPLRSTGNVEYANYFMRQMGLTAPATVRYAKTSREGQAITRLLMANQDKGRSELEVKTQVENASAYLVMEMVSGTSIQTLDDAKATEFLRNDPALADVGKIMVSDAFLGNTDRLIGGNVNLGNFFYEAAALLAPGVTHTIDNESRFGASSTEIGRSGTKRVSGALSGRIDYLKELMTPAGRDTQIGLFFAKFRQVQRLNLSAIAVLQSDEARIRAAINTGITSSMKQMADLFAENPALLRAVSVGDPESAATRNYSTAKAAAKFTRELQVMDPATATERLVAYVEYRAKRDRTPPGFKWVTKLMSGPA